MLGLSAHSLASYPLGNDCLSAMILYRALDSALSKNFITATVLQVDLGCRPLVNELCPCFHCCESGFCEQDPVDPAGFWYTGLWSASTALLYKRLLKILSVRV